MEYLLSELFCFNFYDVDKISQMPSISYPVGLTFELRGIYFEPLSSQKLKKSVRLRTRLKQPLTHLRKTSPQTPYFKSTTCLESFKYLWSKFLSFLFIKQFFGL